VRWHTLMHWQGSQDALCSTEQNLSPQLLVWRRVLTISPRTFTACATRPDKQEKEINE
jgi:hypothetical protein